MDEPGSADNPRGEGMSRTLERMLNRTVGGLTGEVGRVASTTHSFLLFSLAISLSYSVLFMSYDLLGMTGLIAVNMIAAAGYVVGLLIVRMGRQGAAAILALGIATVHILLSTQYLGWQSGLHLYLIAGGQLVLMLFTEQQKLYRWTFVMVAAVTFVYCQFVFTADVATYEMPQSTLNVLFSVNAVITALLMYALAAFAHVRAALANRLAAESAARAEYLANTDALTGLSNRRPVMEHLESLGATYSQEYCVALADLDRFKGLNDEYGHVCGDRVLATLGERLRAQLRGGDSVGRWGGEEFVFVLPNVTLEDATTMMERMRHTVGDHVVPCAGHSHHVTVSIGVACRPHGALSHRVIKRADDALYLAKQGGRNQVRALKVSDESVPSRATDVLINPDGGEGHRAHRPPV